MIVNNVSNHTMKKLPTTVVVLGAVSFFNDIASDMILPLLPIFLTATLGAGPAVLGLIEGVAEATASLLKLWAGRLGDAGVGHKRLALTGYSISNIVRPLVGFAGNWPTVLALRFADRIGKGIRTAPRDALLAAAVDASERGRAFGFHRSMDHAGAMVGPLIASALLALGMGMQDVFLASVVPGALAVLLLAFGVPRDSVAALPAIATPPLPPLRWSALDIRLRGLVLASGGLALAAVPEVMLILWLSQSGVSVVWIPLVWALAHGIRALVALPAGRLSDRFGRLPVVLTGWLSRAVLLGCIPWFTDLTAVIILFLIYAAVTASTEGAERALIGDVADPAAKGAAFGIYHMTVGLLALPGAIWFGVVWEMLGKETAFLLSAGLTLVMTVWLWHSARQAQKPPTTSAKG